MLFSCCSNQLHEKIAADQYLELVRIFCQYFANSISRLLLPVDGAHAAACEEMATAMSGAESAAYKGLQQCIETLMAEVCVNDCSI